MRISALFLALALCACDSSTPNPIATGPACIPAGAAETSCTDAVDDDCDGYVDCLDSECEGQTCGAGGALMCTAGACVQPGADGLPPLPRIENVRVTMRGDTAIVEFEPVAGARDYRVYVRPDPSDVLVGADGEVVVENAIYRCAGDRPFRRREDDPSSGFDRSLTAEIRGYTRQESEALLGYVYLTPGPGRTPVYRMADPQRPGGAMNVEWTGPAVDEFNAAEYVAGTEERDRAFAAGMRDDGIAFYAPDDGPRQVYYRRYSEDWAGHWDVYYIDGPEADARREHPPEEIAFDRQPFRVLDAPAEGAVELRRVTYNGGGWFDVLAAGAPRYERVLHQGNQPLWSVTWSGLSEATTLVVEALDQGCPFAGGYVMAKHADSTGDNNAPSLTLDEARLASGEVFINGQHAETNRPRAIARAFVDVTPEPLPTMDWYRSFSEAWVDPPEVASDGNNGYHVFRDPGIAIEFGGTTTNYTFGPLLGQLAIGCGDGGSSCFFSVMPRGIDTQLSAATYLHARMTVDIASTLRRYPQIAITTIPFREVGEEVQAYELPVFSRIANDIDGGGTNKIVMIQPFGLQDFEVQFCDDRGWGVGNQCPRANTAGRVNHWENGGQPWLPVAVMGSRSGWDRPVQFDAYVSTERVYLFVDDEPAGCAILPPGRMPAGPVSVLFNAVGYHMDIDDQSDPSTGHQYLRTYSFNHTDRRFDELGVTLNAPLPAWDETRIPCGSEWGG
jgi:hypothetical protein